MKKFQERIAGIKISDPRDDAKNANKMRVLRLNSFYMAEVDMRFENSHSLSNEFKMPDWKLKRIQMPHKFLAFSRYVFLDMNNILVFGGLDDTQEKMLDFFTNYCYQLKVLKFHLGDEMLVCNPIEPMSTGRGCFATCIKDGFAFVFGGVSGKSFNQNQSLDEFEDDVNDIHLAAETKAQDQILKACEKYDTANDQWYQIASLPQNTRNASACALSSDSIYLFGGKTFKEGLAQLSDQIYMYLIAANMWIELPLRMPQKRSLATLIRINDYQIAIFGGLTYQKDQKKGNKLTDNEEE